MQRRQPYQAYHLRRAQRLAHQAGIAQRRQVAQELSRDVLQHIVAAMTATLHRPT